MVLKYLKSSADTPMDTGAVRTVVSQFLKRLELPSFKVDVLLSGSEVFVLIQAEPHRNLRYSNLLEIKLKACVEAEVRVRLKAVFWRFKIDERDIRGLPEQDAYNWLPPEGASIPAPVSAPRAEKADAEGPPSVMQHPSRSLESIHVDEASWDEFEQLKGEGRPPV